MKLFDRTFATAEENLACDEVLLAWAEAGQGEETLRFWEPAETFVVLGRSNRPADEVNLAACAGLGIPVLRRCSGGGTVLQGPGCLNYALILRHEATPELAGVTQANRLILERHRAAFSALLGEPVEIAGVTDLSVGGRKFSGNAQRRTRRFLLFHGTILLGLDLALMERALPLPSQPPPYREGRPHRDFLRNLSLSSRVAKNALQATWRAHLPLAGVPTPQIDELVAARYSQPLWRLRL